MELLFAGFFLVVILFALWMEYRRGCVFSSPLFFIILSNLSVFILYFFTQDLLEFHQLNITTLAYLISGCGLFAFPSIVVSFIPNLTRRNVLDKSIDGNISNTVKIVILITTAIMFYRIYTLGLYNILNNEETEAIYGGNGFTGHILVLQIFLLIHVIGCFFKFKNIPYYICLLICLFVYNVKSWVIIPFIVGALIHFYIRGKRIKLWLLVCVCLIVFIFFTISYMLVLGWNFDNMTFIFAHFFKYIFAGIGGLNEAIINSYPTDISPLYDLPSFINIIFDINTISEPVEYNYMVINDVNQEWTNVLSLIGSTLLLNGPVAGSIILIIIAIISYILYYVRLNSNNYWFVLSYYIWSAGLLFSFFGNYYKLLNLWEITFFALFIGLINKFYKFVKKKQ